MRREIEREFKRQIYDHFAEVCKAFANSRRLEILELLSQGEFSVDELSREIQISVASASQHLQSLRAARLVKVRREGVKANYRLANPNVYLVIHALHIQGEDLLPDIDQLVKQYLPLREHLCQIEFADLVQSLDSNTLFVIDVRTQAEYQSGHIRGAVSIPLHELEDRLKEIPTGSKVIVYCRGPYSMLADDAVSILTAHGYEALRLKSGYPQWRMEGYPTEPLVEPANFENA